MSEQLTQLTDTLIKNVTHAFLTSLQEQVTKQVMHDVTYKLSQLDYPKLIRDQVGKMVVKHMKDFDFPVDSIPPSAIKLLDMQLSGNNISSGIIKHFGSTGIQDNATACQVTILDQATVFENTLVAAALTIAGNTTISGTLTLKGDVDPDSSFYHDIVDHSAGKVRASLDEDFFSQYSQLVFDRIKKDGIDLSNVTLDGKELISGNRIGFGVTESNLQTVGHLKELQVTGESLLSSTLYVNKGRVGINTLEPSAALSVWDEECEIVIAKRRKDTAIIGTVRNQSVVLSSNSNDNLTLETDGSVTVNRLTVGAVNLSSSDRMPSADAKRGSVVFNELPEPGKPFAWISLGGARWAPVGLIS